MDEIDDRYVTPEIEALLHIIEENVRLRENYDTLKTVYDRLEKSNDELGKRFDALIAEIKALRARIAESERDDADAPVSKVETRTAAPVRLIGKRPTP
jgi:predicted nuclease with TOPRIM domain